MSTINKEINDAAQAVCDLVGNYNSHIERIKSFELQRDAIKQEVSEFLEKTELPSDEAINLTVSKEAKLTWLRGSLLNLDRQIEAKLSPSLALGDKCLSLLKASMLEEKQQLLSKIAAAIEPYFPDYRDNGALKRPSITVAQSSPLLSVFDELNLAITVPVFFEQQSRTGWELADPARWDREGLDYLGQVLKKVEQWENNGNSFTPRPSKK